MAKDLLDFSKFKKIFSDDKNTHLQHPKGHTIIVAHVALTPKLKKQIADLPMHPKEMMEKALEVAEDAVEHMPKKMAEGGKAEKPAVSRIDMNYKDVTKRIPQLTEAANKLTSGKLSASEYDELVNKHKPVEAYGFVPQPATREDAMRALNESKRKMYGKHSEMTAGEPADLRLDIPAYKEHGVWVNSIHRKDAPTVYGSVSSVNNAQMVPSSEKALRVAAGGPKAPFAVIRGEWNPMEEEEAVAKAQKFLKHKDWKQVGYDPERHGYFYDRETMQPIEGAEQVIQIGPLVLAKKPRYGKKEEQLFAEGGDVEEYAKGGRTSALLDKKGNKINKKSERERIFGDNANAPRMSDERMRMMNMLRDKVKQEYGVGLRTAAGKRTESGDIRDEGVQPAFDVYTPEGHEAERRYVAEQKALNPKFKRIDPKPDWNNPDKFMDTQPSPDAGIHEVAHARQIPLGMTLAEHQDAMDALQGQVQKDYGFLQNKRTSHEIQPMAMENSIRRELGFPANSSVATGTAHGYVENPETLAAHNAGRVSRGQPALETNEEGIPLTHDTKEPMYVAGLDHKGNVVYYMRQSRLMSPENRQRTEDMRQKTVKYHPERGMVESMSPDALINLRGQGRMAEAEHRLRNRGEERFAEGGQVGMDAIKKERYYADQGFVEPMTEEEQDNAPQDFGMDMTEPSRAPASDFPNASEMPQQPAEPDFAQMVAENPANPYEQKFKQYREEAENAVPFASRGLKPGMSPQQLDEWALNKTIQDKRAADQQQKQTQAKQSRMDTYHQQLEKNNQAKMQALGIPTTSRNVAGAPSAEIEPSVTPTQTAPATTPSGMGGPAGAKTTTTQGQQKMSNEEMVGLDDYNRGLSELLGGVYGAAAAKGKMEDAKKDSLDASITQQQEIKNKYDKIYTDAIEKNNALVTQYQNERIDPMAVWNDKSVPGKIASAIGLILGGIGGGLTHQENPAMKFLQFQIDKSVEGQKMRLGRTQNLLTHNLNVYKNMSDALTATRAQIAEITAKQIERDAAKYGNELQRSLGQQAAGEIRMKHIFTPFQKLAYVKRMQDPTSSDIERQTLLRNMSVGFPEEARQLATQDVPNYMMANTTVDRGTRDALNAFNTFDQRANELLHLLDKNRGQLWKQVETSLKPWERETIQTIADELLPQLADANRIQVSEGTKQYLQHQISKGNPASVWNAFVNNNAALRATIEGSDMKHRQLISSIFGEENAPALFEKNKIRNKRLSTQMQSPYQNTPTGVVRKINRTPIK